MSGHIVKKDKRPGCHLHPRKWSEYLYGLGFGPWIERHYGGG